MAFVFKSILLDISITTASFFHFPLHGIIFFFHSFTFSLCKSFVLRWVSCRQHICESCFLIHSATLCLLTGAFNPFTIKLIIDRYLLIASSFLQSMFLSLFPLLKVVLLESLAMLVWWRCILLAFHCLENSLFCLPF